MFYQLHHVDAPEYLKREEGENFSYPPHMHQCYELVVIVDGEMDITVDSETMKVTRGEAVLIFPNRLHSLSSATSKHLLLIFSPKIVQTFTVKYSGKLPVSPKFRISDGLLSSLAAIDADDSLVKIKGLLYSVAAEFEDKVSFRGATSDKDDLLVQIFGFVDKNAKLECTLTDAARAIGYDHAYISRYFKKITGMSYNSYVNVCRLNNAGYLLKNSDLSILECAIESGYKSLRSFNRNFKEYFGMTPIEYRHKS